MNFHVNESLSNDKVRIVDSDFISEKDIVQKNQALRFARSKDLDLIEIKSQKDISICILDNFDKFKYRKQKEEKEKQKQQRQSAIAMKDIQIRPVTDTNDLMVKARKIKSIIDDGDQVKISVKFKGREVSHIEQGKQVLDTLLSKVGDFKIDKPQTFSNKVLSVIISKQKETN